MVSILEVVRRCEGRFGIHMIEPMGHASGARVFLVIRANTDMVLKVGLNGIEVNREVHALKSFSGSAAIHVIDYDPRLPALLLERAVPGHPLSAITDDNRATEIFCSVFLALNRKPVMGVQSIQEHVSAINRYQETWHASGPLPASWVGRAVDYLEGLIASTDRPALLHGDLHHANILRHQGAWVVIDPKGILGDLHLDVIQYLLNYASRGGDAATVLARRMAMVAERLGLDEGRIARWGVVKGILDACWALEDGTDWHSGLVIAERFEWWLARSGDSKA